MFADFRKISKLGSLYVASLVRLWRSTCVGQHSLIAQSWSTLSQLLFGLVALMADHDGPGPGQRR